MPSVQKLIAKVESALGSDGRVVVRYSGTESKARVMIEGTDEPGIKAYANEIADTLKQALAG
jgi:phosphoglucosamine mutase